MKPQARAKKLAETIARAVEQTATLRTELGPDIPRKEAEMLHCIEIGIENAQMSVGQLREAMETRPKFDAGLTKITLHYAALADRARAIQNEKLPDIDGALIGDL